MLQHPSSTSKQQSSQQQQQHQEQQQQQQQDTSGSPIASLLACAAQAKLLVAGAASAIVSRTAMAPLERVKMDLLLKTSSRSAVDTAVWVWQREGLAGFWKGNGLNLLRTAPFKVGVIMGVCVWCGVWAAFMQTCCTCISLSVVGWEVGHMSAGCT